MSNLLRQGDANLVAFGQFGGELLGSGGTSTDGKVIVAITFLVSGALSNDANTVVEVGSGCVDTAGQEIPAGVTIFGRWTKVTTATDVSVIAYYGE